jgi:hypothetical protein
MATITPANHFHDPRSSRPHSRRNSTRRSFASSLSRSSSYLDSPRTACPKDGDAFAYNPAKLNDWYCPQYVWDSLPSSVQKSLAAVQHAGASALTGMLPTIFVLSSMHCAIGCNDARYPPLSRRMCCVHIELTISGFERLNEHSGVDNGSRTDQRTPEDEVLVDLDELRPQKFRTASNASSVFPGFRLWLRLAYALNVLALSVSDYSRSHLSWPPRARSKALFNTGALFLYPSRPAGRQVRI